jgi:hypothetical protein
VSTPDLRSVLERIRGIRHACDLDLLLFFYRHPRALLTSEQLVAYLGYDGERVAKSLDAMIEAGYLTRSQYPSHAARLYALELAGVPGDLLSSLLKIASTSQGRRDVIQVLESGPNHTPNGLRLLRRSENGHG